MASRLILELFKMKRKIIQIANSTNVVSLPKAWTEEFNIVKGQEVELHKLKNSILIKTDNTNQDEITIDVTNLEYDLIWRYLITSYRKGTEVIKIKHSTKDFENIYSFVKDLVGMAVVKHSENEIELKDFFFNYSENDLDKMLKRVFNLVLDMSKDVLIGIKDKNVGNLKNMEYRDYNVNKFANLCLRILNKSVYGDYNKSLSFYKFISILEEIGDEYRRTAMIFSRDMVDVNEKVLEVFSDVNGLLLNYYSLFYEYSNDKMSKFHNECNLVSIKLKNSYGGKKIGIQILSSLDTTLHLIKNMSEESLVVNV